MRTSNVASYQLIGATAVAMLCFNLPSPASATTEQPATAAVVGTLNEAPIPAAAAGPADQSVAVPKSSETTTESGAISAKPKPLPPTLFARINLTNQTMVVQAGGKTIHTWKVSSGAPGYATPPGTFKPGWMAKMWYSRQYDDAPMPYSVFFNGGIAVHGTMNPGSLGRAASHGCVRLATSNAERFYKLVSQHGMAQTRIIVHGAQPFSRHELVASRAKTRAPRAANEWYYSSSTPAPRAVGRAGASRYDSYGYAPAPQPRRINTARSQRISRASY